MSVQPISKEGKILRIKKLDIVGFKSFKDRTVIEFDKGITGVVGPNGCGKSNIVDALVWVMGEMSAKHLRGDSMHDVIFGGSQDYAPSGMAEVSLTLENDGGAFPVKYMGLSELMVTRRLHRSGESEYLINKEQARLRDIQEIFMDTGAGSKGFSIVEQGKIGQMISAKPLDRRILIEEAAGITKFKARKKESQRKLAATDQNLLRLQDIISELKKQLNSLDRQAKKAEAYRKLKKEMETIDLWLCSREYVELQSSVDESQTAFSQAEEAHLQIQVELNKKQAQLADIKVGLSDLENAVTQKQEFHFQSKEKVVAEEKSLQEHKFEIESTRRNQQTNQDIQQEQMVRHQSLVRNKTELEEKVSVTQKESLVLDSQFDEKNQQYQDQQRQMKEIEEQLTSHQKNLLDLTQRKSHLEAKIDNTDEQLVEFHAQREEFEKHLAELETKQKQFEKCYRKIINEFETEKQMHLDMSKDVASFQANADILKTKLEDKKTELQEAKDHLNEASSLLYGLENLQSNFEGFDEGVKSIMFWQKEKVQSLSADGSVSVEESYRPVSQVIDVDQKYEVALEATLGQKLQALVTSSEETSLEALDYLKAQASGRSSFINSTQTDEASSSLNSKPGGEGVIAFLDEVVKTPKDLVQKNLAQTVNGFLCRVAIVDSVRTALRLRPQHKGWSFVTLEGDVLTSDGVLTGGAAGTADSGVLKRKRRIEELSEKKQEWKSKLSLLQLSVDKLQEQYERVIKDSEQAQKSYTGQEIRLAEIKKDVERTRMERDQANGAVNNQRLQLDKLYATLSQSESRYLKITQELKEIGQKKENTEQSVSDLQKRKELFESDVQELQAQVMELKISATSKSKELEGLKSQLSMVASSLSDIDGQLSRMDEQSVKNGETLSSGELVLQEKQMQLEKLISQVDESRLALAQAQDVYEQNATGLRELETQINESLADSNRYQSQINEAQLKKDQSQMKQNHLQEHIGEKYLLDLSKIAHSHTELAEDPNQAKIRIEDLKTQISKMGEVNLSAIEEHSQTRQRYEFLSQQHEDLIEAKEQLNRVINRINRICSKRFKETFAEINIRFEKVFPTLFGGGEARLVLVEDVDKGEMGIDIVAKPPGKKLQSISLMSGGEKALTAVSLIFSIFLVKPSPYCLLDEVDAPLDDANVARFNDLVAEMAKRSQIIVVTHNKYTMEVVEKLYGVTMQERGVSQMVSVSLNSLQ